MSSWKNAHKAHQKPHRERHQPEARKHLGHLEKKKDYRLRADDYNQKKSELQYLHKKALDRNPDEFYYHMVNSETNSDGTHVDKAKRKQLTPEQILLMQTQDFKYIANRRNVEAKKIARCKERNKAYKELEQRRVREKKLSTLQRKMEIKRALQDKTRTIKSRIKPESKDEAPVYEWKWERKR
ncbi:unnamed protein product [Allacma fusca]|uniref:Probable U3 small nucleolar RNA-associated protein 11 n=1 Tax=Allacma fusca TaxID=39272 RepID=A0A8J2LTJ7_9HEXA|nr:unnamed protein product [Allacma fusca]